ncbi:MAG: response regulator transcription factor [Bacteroidetes bacterium]|nr:response regulator transcription factor [Bacteroidota bacterium]
MKAADSEISIIVVDDHRLFNDGLRAMLQSQGGMKVLAPVYDSREARNIIRELAPDVVLVDFNMPHLNGIELTQQLISEWKEINVLILSMYNEDIYIDRFKRSGCKGYIFKTASVEEVVAAIRAVHGGETYFPTLTKTNVHTDDLFLKKLRLSTREMEVVRLVKNGLTTKEIADQLNISFYTAETHRKNIKLKIGVEGEAAFLRFVYSIDLED